MSIGRTLQPDKDCEYCAKPLPALRHPNTKYCDAICRGRDRWQHEHGAANGVKCLDCGKTFTRVGSHVVQVHGYESTLEYRHEHGLMAKETRLDSHASAMRSKVSTMDNLKNGAKTQYIRGGDHGERVKQFWSNREQKLGHRKRKLEEDLEEKSDN